MQNLQTSDKREWRATTPLMKHQVEAVAKLLPSRVGGLFMEMGTGKSRTAIELARLRQAKIDRVVWFCPVSLKVTVAREIAKHTDCGDGEAYVFNDRTREDTVPLGRFWYVAGIESMSLGSRALYAVLRLIDERTMVIVDESTYIKGHWAKRTKRVTAAAERARYRLILTGTPITQGAVDLYSQMRFLSPKILGYDSFYTFSRNHLVYSSKYRGQIVGTLDYNWIVERIRPYVYQVTKAECLDLPDKLYSDRHCELSEEQWQAYKKAKEDFADDLLKYFDEDSDLSNGIAIFRLFSRLQSIACGYHDGLPLRHERLDLLAAVLAKCDESHIVIWAKYRASVHDIVHRIEQEGRRAWAYDGSVPERRREAVLDGWRHQGGCLVATQSLGGHGLDLTAAATVIFYSRGFKYSENIQAEGRCHRIGQDHVVHYVSLWGDCGIEQRISDAIFHKGNALERLRREIDKVKRSGRDKLRAYIMSL